MTPRRRYLGLAACAWLTACTQPKVENEPLNRYHLTGKVVKVDGARKLAWIEHQPIKDDQGKVWMDAMTMEFPVRAPEDWAKVKVGQRIHAVVWQRPSDYEYWVSEVQVVN